MASNFVDQNAPRFNGTLAQLPLGLVPPPKEILEHVTNEKTRLQPFYTDEYAKRILDDMTLAFYYEGNNVAYRSVEQGVEVLAVGFPEVGEFLKNTPPEKRAGVIIKQP
jgi:hypothetical protein